jgi:glucan phosphoethanolaminetransferase (alkaline phosphatase superfamily)
MLAWSIVLIYDANLYENDYQVPKGEIFTPFMGIIACSITIIILGVLILFPFEFKIYAILCSVWGLINLLDGGSSSGLLMYLLGITFAFHARFFKRYYEIKIIVVSLFPIFVILSQMRFGAEKTILSMINALAVLLICLIAYILFLPDIQKLKKKKQKDSHIAHLSAEQFTLRDVRCLQKVQNGEKYESIAKEENIGLSTLKNRMKLMYESLNVYDKTSFMAAYAGHIIKLKPSTKTPFSTDIQTIDNESE